MPKTQSTINWTPIVVIGLGLGGLYYLSKPNADGSNKLQDAAGNFIDNFNPFKNAGWDWSNWSQDGKGKDDNGDGGAPPIVDESRSLIPPAKVIQEGVGRFVGIGARGYASSALTGKALPMLYKSGQVAKAAGPYRQAAVRTFERIGSRVEAAGLKRVGVIASERVAIKGLEVGAVKVTSRLMSRTIPIVGWGLALADIAADVSRVFGARPPSWLGWSSIPAAFSTTGQNPIERWADR